MRPRDVIHSPCDDDADYAAFLDSLGSGTAGELTRTLHTRLVTLPNTVAYTQSGNEEPAVSKRDSPEARFVDRVFPDINDTEACASSAILATTNAAVHYWNDHLLDRLPGPVVELFAANKVHNDDTKWDVDEARRPVLKDILTDEFLQSYMHPGIPLHRLKLKVGSVCMLMRNLRPADKLMNGTKFVLRRVLSAKALLCERLDEHGHATGHIFVLPRITMTYTLPTTAVQLLRLQFPCMLAYALTFNKAQGQTLSRVGIDVRAAVFSHGQAFVAFSRVRASNCCHVIGASNTPTFSNVVMTPLINAFM